jgi:hypothetical protein
MPTILLSIGTVTVITQNVVYALPAKPSTVVTTIPCQTSTDGVAWNAFNSGEVTVAKFIRCTTGAPTVSVSNAVAGGNNVVANALAIGPIPALTGDVRLSNGSLVRARNQANTADVDVINVTGTTLNIGQTTLNSVVKSPTTFQDIAGFLSGTTFAANLTINETGYININKERLSVPVRDVLGANIWLEDNGAGKSRLMVMFGTGAAIQLAIEP